LLQFVFIFIDKENKLILSAFQENNFAKVRKKRLTLKSILLMNLNSVFSVFNLRALCG